MRCTVDDKDELWRIVNRCKTLKCKIGTLVLENERRIYVWIVSVA